MRTEPDDVPVARVRRGRRHAGWGLASVAILVTVGLTGLLGERTGVAAAEEDGYRLEVEYPKITRSALPMRWRLTLTHPEGFAGRIRIATTIEYFRLFDLNWLHPAPADEISAGGRTIWFYDAPEGDSLSLLLDGRMEPGLFEGESATTSITITGGPRIDVSYETKVWP